MENAILILLFLTSLVVFLTMLKINVWKIGALFVMRALSGIIIIQLVNYCLRDGYTNLLVSINEITVMISGIFGFWGVVFCYAMRIYFTIWC